MAKKTKPPGIAVTYAAAPGAPFNDREAPAIGLRLELLEARGPVTPDAIVEDARAPESPLHPFFTWDDAAAADSWRKDEARHLTNHLLVKIYRDGREVETKGWHSIKIVNAGPEGPERAYASLATVSNSPALRAQVVAQAVKELAYWQRRYGQYEELFGVSAAIDKARECLEGAARETKPAKGKKPA
jgi:hypothetical protein